MRTLLIVLLLLGLPTIQIKTVVKPEAHLSTKWAFIIDGSSSLWTLQSRHRLVDKMNMAFSFATKHISDEFQFCIYVFSNKNRERFKDWEWASVDELTKAHRWVRNRRRDDIYSHGRKSFELALRQKTERLSIIVITDGGFSSHNKQDGFGAVDRTIQEGQKWRVEQDYERATITTIGIENRWYYGGNKPSDEVCQAFLRRIGSENGGGYYYVHEK